MIFRSFLITQYAILTVSGENHNSNQKVAELRPTLTRRALMNIRSGEKKMVEIKNITTA